MSCLKLFDVSSKAALVTGGSKGLGKSMARALALAGADVVISSRHQDELERALPDILAGTNRRGVAIVADLSKRDEAERLGKAAIEKLGRIDILVNNAGTNIPQPVDQMKDDDWDSVLTLNLTACMALTRAFDRASRHGLNARSPVFTLKLSPDHRKEHTVHRSCRS